MSGRLDAALANSPSLSVDIAARAVRIEQLPVAAGGPDRATGTADADVRLRGTGDNLQGIISGLEGDGSVRLGDVRIPDAGEGFLETDINVASASASFTVTNGVAHNEDLAATGSNYIATGRGTIDIGARTVDYVLTPVIGSVSVPVEITGPWHNPAYRIDLQGIPGVEALLDEAVEDVLASLLEDGIEGLPDLAEGLDPGRLLGLQVDGPQDNAGETGSELERLREGLGGLLRGLTGE